MNDGGPAFPRPSGVSHDGSSRAFWTPAQEGMSLQDWLAGQALSAYLGSDEMVRRVHNAIEVHTGGDPDVDPREVFDSVLAKSAYDIADAMLIERENRNGPTKP